MANSIHARLDADTDALREELKQRQGWSDSEIVRRGIKLLASMTPAKGKRKLCGVGKYDSGVPDLATNKAHLEGFGKS